MRGGLRHRRDNHAGIPQGSTMGFGNKCQIALLWNQGLTIEEGEIHEEGQEDAEEVDNLVGAWADQATLSNNAVQETLQNCPRQNADKSVEFYNHSDAADYADYMTLRLNLQLVLIRHLCLLLCVN